MNTPSTQPTNPTPNPPHPTTNNTTNNNNNNQPAADPNRRHDANDIVVLFENVEKIYQKSPKTPPVIALGGINMAIHRGEYFAIMGPSGSGKSTMLNILGCLDRPSNGRFMLDGQDISQIGDRELSQVRGKQLGFVFQAFNLIPQLTVSENIQVPLFYQAIPAKQRRQRAEHAASRVGLLDRLHHRPSELSGGQQQRVAVARALVSKPSFLLADEPTGNLDSSTGQAILNLFDELHDQGLTIIMVTHDPSIATRCQRTIWLRDGLIEREIITSDNKKLVTNDS